jgi:hypothetical protein
MKKNMSVMDRWIRVAIALIVSILFITGTVTGTLGIVLLAIGGILLATTIINFCPLYAIFGISTCPIEKK